MRFAKSHTYTILAFYQSSFARPEIPSPLPDARIYTFSKVRARAKFRATSAHTRESGRVRERERRKKEKLSHERRAVLIRLKARFLCFPVSFSRASMWSFFFYIVEWKGSIIARFVCVCENIKGKWYCCWCNQ